MTDDEKIAKLQAEHKRLCAVVLAVAQHLENERNGKFSDLDDSLMEALGLTWSDEGYFLPESLRALAGGRLVTAFPDVSGVTPIQRAALAYQIATGRALDFDSATSWAIDVLARPSHHFAEQNRRTVEAMLPWLDEVVTDDDTRSRLGLGPKPVAETWPAWDCFDGFCDLHMSFDDASGNVRPVAEVIRAGWNAYAGTDADSPRIGDGPETGTAGMDAAEAALRLAKVLPEGVTVRRPEVPRG